MEVNQKQNNKKKGHIKTYRDFAVDALKNKPTSLARMIIKEKRKREVVYEHSVKNKKNIFFIILSLILFTVGILAVYFVFNLYVFEKEISEINKKVLDPKSIIYFDYREEKDISDFSRLELIKFYKNDIKESTIPFNKIKIVYYAFKDGNFKKLASSRKFLEFLDTNIPRTLFNNLKNEYTNGFSSKLEGNNPFIIFKIRSFDVSYSSILKWEKNIMYDLGSYLSVDKKYFSKNFLDIVVNNKDVRGILNNEGKIVFGYSFTDLDTLVFFTDRRVFEDILKSLRGNKKL